MVGTQLIPSSIPEISLNFSLFFKQFFSLSRSPRAKKLHHSIRTFTSDLRNIPLVRGTGDFFSAVFSHRSRRERLSVSRKWSLDGGVASVVEHGMQPASESDGELIRALCIEDRPFETGTKRISRKAAGGFNLVPYHRLGDHLVEDLLTNSRQMELGGLKDVFICYKLPEERARELILIQRMEDCIDLDDFEISSRYDINTTGLVCCWPSEDVLANFCVKNSYLFRSRRVLELGSGYGLAGLAIAATTDANEVVISDGNPQVVDYIQRNININADAFGKTKVTSMTLHWNQEQTTDTLNTFDIIIASDCTFFKEFHESLARTVKSLLKYSEGSEAFFLSPKRGDSLDKFLEKIGDNGLHYKLVENYDSQVWNLHKKFINGDDSSWPNYDKDHCYPLLAKVTFSTPEHTIHAIL